MNLFVAIAFALLETAAVAVAAESATGEEPIRLMIGFDASVSRPQRRTFLRKYGMSELEDYQESSFYPMNLTVVELQERAFHASSLTIQAQPEVRYVERDQFRADWLAGAEALPPLPTLEEVAEGLRLKVVTSAAPPLPAAGTAVLPIPLKFAWDLERLNVPAAWKLGDGRSEGIGVKVAVIDSGVDCTHPQLQCRFEDGTNIVEPDRPPVDDYWHGTHVAGTIAARYNPANGMSGIVPRAKIMPIRVFDEKGQGWLSNVIKGILWAANHGADVANLSLSAPNNSLFLKSAVLYAKYKGMTVVAAAGNEGPYRRSVMYPAAYEEVIAVSASDRTGAFWEQSSAGKQIAFIAPGADILSTMPGGKYDSRAGTSMATAHVSGLAAMAIAIGARGPDEVRAALERAARLTGLSREQEGAGMIDAARLIPAN